MTNPASLLRLMSWLSPVFPIGGFAYSAGLEQAVASGHVKDRNSLADWINVQISQGALWNDSVILIEAHRCAKHPASITELSELCVAMCPGQERLEETTGQGTSFLEAVSHWIEPNRLPERGTPLPVVVGVAAGLDDIEQQLTVGAYLHAFVSNQLQCAIRLSVVGQEGAAAILAGLESLIAERAESVSNSTLEDLGGAAFIADIASMNHETLEPRLFLS